MSDDFASMLELDLPKVAPVAPKATTAPAITVATPAPSPLVAGRTLLTSATTLEGLDSAAQAVAKACNAAGLTDKAHPTRVQLRAILYRLVLTSIAWLRLWGSLARAIEQRPALVMGQPVAPTVAATGDAMIDSLMGIATEGAHNATAHGAGSLAGGQLAGVGFTSAEGYVTALRNGVKAATAESYKRILATQYQYTPDQVAGLQVTILADAVLPVGAGITHAPVGGKSVADMTPAEVKAAWAKPVLVTAEGETTRAVREAMRSGEIMAVADATASGKAYMWNGMGETTRGTLRTVLANAGLPESMLPAQASAIATAGLVLRDENRNGYIAKPERMIKGSQLRKRAKVVMLPNGMPRAYLTRWTIQEPSHGEVGEAAGTIVATATVWADGSLTVDGATDIRDRVEGEYNRRRDEEVYEAGQVTAWLQNILTGYFNALLYFGWYVPAKHVAAVDRLYSAIDGVWGSWRVPMPMVTCDALRAGLTKGLADEVNSILADVEKAHAAGLVATPRKMQISAAQAATFLTQLQELAARAAKHVEILGGTYAGKVRAGIEVAMEKLKPLCDDSSMRAALLELNDLTPSAGK